MRGYNNWSFKPYIPYDKSLQDHIFAGLNQEKTTYVVNGLI